MANVRTIRRRIRSVQNTAKITKAMQMIAASKMRRAQQLTLAGRPYSEKMRDVLADLSAQPREAEEIHPLLQDQIRLINSKLDHLEVYLQKLSNFDTSDLKSKFREFEPKRNELNKKLISLKRFRTRVINKINAKADSRELAFPQQAINLVETELIKNKVSDSIIKEIKRILGN